MEILYWIKNFCLLKQQLKTKLPKFSTRSAVDLAHKIYGDDPKAPTIIVVHGLLGQMRNWRSISSKIHETTKYKVVAVDARNHGQSPWADSHTYMDLAADLIKLLDSLQLDNATFLGHSMGGRAAMVLALTEPSRVKSLIVVDISPVTTPSLSFLPRLMDLMKSVKFQAKDAAGARAEAKFIMQGSNLIQDEGTLNLVLFNIGTRPDKTVGWLCNVEVLQKFFSEIATFPTEMAGKQYTGPSLFLAGALSQFIKPSDIKGIQGFFPNAKLHFISKAGHNVHIDDPATLTTLIAQFLQ